MNRREQDKEEYLKAIAESYRKSLAKHIDKFIDIHINNENNVSSVEVKRLGDRLEKIHRVYTELIDSLYMSKEYENINIDRNPPY